MAKYSQKVMGKEVGSGEVYAEPHTMTGKKISAKEMQGFVEKTPSVNGPVTDVLNISVGGISKGNYKSINPYGTGVMRGYGAATKGRKISGKMG
jgi:hypothetical protein